MIVPGFNGGSNLIHEESFEQAASVSHDSAAVLIDDGVVVTAIEQERLDRIKHSNKFPQVGFLFAIGFICVLFSMYATRLYLMDDALITLRYSLNFVRYGHPVWNHADLVRSGFGYGYTSVLWMLLNAVPALFIRNKDALVEISRLLSLIPVGVIVLIMVSRIGRMEAPFLARAVVTVAIFAVGLYGFHINTGMETLLFCCFVLLAVITYGQTQKGVLPYLFVILAFLTRPEGALLLPVICYMDHRSKADRRAAIGAGAFFLTVLVLGVVMKSEYGHYLPNSYYLKQVHHINSRAVTKTLMFFRYIALPLLPFALLSVYRLKDKTAVLCWYTAMLFTAYYLTVAEIMNIMYRFQMPVLVLLTYASLPAIEMVLKDWKRWRVGATVVLIVACVCNVIALRNETVWSNIYGTTVSNFTTLGKAMKSYEVDDRWVVFDWAGEVPYYSDWDTCDVFGLADYPLAKNRAIALNVIRSPHTELMIVYQVVNKAFPTSDTDRELAKLSFFHAKDPRITAVQGYTPVRDIPVMIDGVKSFAVIRVYSRHPEATRAMLSNVKFAPNRPLGWLESRN